MEPQVHLGGFVLNVGIGMGGGVIKELVNTEGEIFPGAGGNGGGDGADCCLHSIVYCTGVVVEDACELLTVFELCWCELTFVACVLCKLLFLSICRGSVGVRGVLWFLWRWMAEPCKCFRDIVWHGKVNGSFGVVP